ncbi:MAG TPA: putative sugar nucleotidyl transferase [Gemmatimonadaceae bacterium]|nr:putative sugar nucleotidyl transferase [Gemmatimonadaceae bacterium]
MTALYLADDDVARTFMPFSLTRPVSELRAGAMLVRHRWERAFGASTIGLLVAAHLADFEEPGAPRAARDGIPRGAVLANARCVVPVDWSPPDADVWLCDGRVAAVRTGQPLRAGAFEGEGPPLESLRITGARTATIPGRWLDAVWGLITGLQEQLAEDIFRLGPQLRFTTPDPRAVLGTHPVYLEEGAIVEPFVLFDATTGPVLVRTGATVRGFTRLAGPCVIDGGSTVLGDRVSGCSIGAGCMIRGEISETIVVGNANKAHEGFVGHSVLGRWVNLGAGTTTSNLKNTYGPVSLATPSGMRDTGLVKLGTFFGDHVKTGIGLRLTTGTVIGAGSSIHGAAMPPKNVAPFSWGEGGALGVYDIDKFIRTAERAMGRRGVKLGDGARRQFAAAHTLGRTGA